MSNRYYGEREALLAQGYSLPRTSRQGYFDMVRTKTYYPAKRGAVTVYGGMAAPKYNKMVAQQRLKARGFKPGYLAAMRTGGFNNPVRAAELKFKDIALNLAVAASSDNFSGPGATTLLNGLVPDSTATGRIGRKIHMKSLYIRYTASLNATSVGGSPLRILVVYDKQANATAPAITDILLTDDFTSPNNISNRDRFVTIFDHITDPISTGDSFAVSGVLHKKFDLETMFNAGVAGTIGDITTGSLYLMVSQAGSISTAGPFLQFQSRMRFDDQ